MTLLEDVECHFKTRDLYEVLGADKAADGREIKKAYRRASLKIHPDRVNESEKENATKKFQVLAQVHYILSDEEKRKLYDEHGVIANEDGLESEADWSAYWRLLFPKVTTKDIDNYLDSYIESKEEESDLIKIYNKYEGDLDRISETHIAYDEDRTVSQLKQLIKDGKIVDYPKFSKEPSVKRAKRKRRYAREAKEADDAPSSDLVAMIRGRANNFDNMIASLEAKYAKKPKNSKKTK